MSNKEIWATRIGLILAMAGNAVGMGNFLRFPAQAAKNGGGAFIIPYFIALILMGIPLMWLEWSMGKIGAREKRHTTISIFEFLWRNPISKYLGSIGVSLTMMFVVYYMVIESWTLMYTFFSIKGSFLNVGSIDNMRNFLYQFQGVESGEFFASNITMLIGWMIIVSINIFILYRGISQGIERLAYIAMPLLVAFALILVVRVFTLGTPDPSIPENSVSTGIAWLYNPDFSKLAFFSVWLAAAGQIFYTLSIGQGTVQTYASYASEKQDVALTGLTTASTNEFCEIVLGGSIAIPVAVAYFGIQTTMLIAQKGSFDIGFVAMPIIFTKIPLGAIFGAIWFILLFFAGLTSSVALASPFIAFLREKFGISRERAVIFTGIIMFLFGLPNALFIKFGYLDQYDFWIGTVALVVFALIEVIVYAWIYGGDKMWEELTSNAEIKIPKIFYYIIKFIVPIYLIVLLSGWLYQDLTSEKSEILLRGVEPEKVPYIW
ncbi:MAG: sodium-dependent transporter, partial [Deltaproteobacteria bacterium]|nr:sodium-dependent transporter [Deltaproteobacteria bacterium]